jgi:hypothetical protein
MIPFQPKNFTPELLQRRCAMARQEFYSWSSIASRSLHRVNYRDPRMWMNYWAINAMHHWDTESRNGLPLGDETWSGTLLKSKGTSLVQVPI